MQSWDKQSVYLCTEVHMEFSKWQVNMNELSSMSVCPSSYPSTCPLSVHSVIHLPALCLSPSICPLSVPISLSSVCLSSYPSICPLSVHSATHLSVLCLSIQLPIYLSSQIFFMTQQAWNPKIICDLALCPFTDKYKKLDYADLVSSHCKLSFLEICYS